jgi:starch phosphorylase
VVGWAVGRGEEYDDGAGDDVEAELLYDLLEREVVPLFFDRDRSSGLPRGWIARMKASIARLVPQFNTARMVKEYTSRFYVPAIAQARRLSGPDLAAATALATWKERVRDAWPQVAIAAVEARSRSEVTVGEPVLVEARVELGALDPADVVVELYTGPTHGGHELERGASVRMSGAARDEDGSYTFVGAIPTRESGAHAFAARVMPWNAAMSHPYETSLVRWA